MTCETLPGLLSPVILAYDDEDAVSEDGIVFDPTIERH